MAKMAMGWNGNNDSQVQINISSNDLESWQLLFSTGGSPKKLGSARFGRLMKAVKDGDVVAPADMRYLKGIPKTGRGDNDSRSQIVSFLSGIYESVAETLPDVRDDTFDPDDVAEAVVSVEVPELMDPYVKAMESQPKSEKKPRKRKFSVTLNTSRKELFAGQERWLPPGHIRDYYEQFKAGMGDDQKVPAFSTFWRVWLQEYPFMKFRPRSNHAECATCIRHKLLIRALTGHMKARQLQVQNYAAHLRSQYQDRLRYWDLRGASRDKTPFLCVCILDGMDQSKFCYPRDDVFKAKSLQTLNRPRAHISACICHGRMVIFTVSPANLPKDANCCIETTANCLHRLRYECNMDLRRMVLHIQADNTSREVKNNHYLRWLGSLVSHGSLARIENFSFIDGTDLITYESCVLP